MIRIENKGDYSKLDKYLKKLQDVDNFSNLDRFGMMGVVALASATPLESGETASSWSYEIERTRNSLSINFNNSNINDHVNIAVILQFGHGTGTGGWVQGRDYINPAIQPVFDQMVDDLWREVTKI